MPDLHAKLFSPSKAEGWFACHGRAVMEAPFPDTGNADSDNGSARHAVVAEALSVGKNAADFVGLEVYRTATGAWVTYKADWVDEDQDYVDTIRTLAEGGELHVEQRLDFRRFIECTDPDDGFGTGDAVILKPLNDYGPDTGPTYELIVADRKTGYHEVPVERNKQLLMYALGAYDEHCLAYEISRVRLIIHQRSAREWDCSVADLLKFAQEARSHAISVVNAVAMHGKVDQAEWESTFLNPAPSEDACRYCKAMATCPAMARAVTTAVGADFDQIAPLEGDQPLANHHAPDLAVAMAAAGLIELWLKAVRAEVERRLLAGQQVPGWGLELGKQGNRAWKDATATEAALKSMRLKVEEMYDLSLISPTTAEKLTKAPTDGKPVIGPKQWTKLQALITRADAKPSVKPAASIKTPYTPPKPSADDFDTVAEASDLA
jgi:hypothetical protein